MECYDYLIIGGGIAGVTAAETIREYDPVGKIGIFTDEPHLLYSRVLLPSYLKKKIPREKVFLRSEKDFEEKRIIYGRNTAITSVNPHKKEVELAGGERASYKKLFIASGGRVKPWGNSAWDAAVYRLQTLDDADCLFHALPRIKKPLVIGGSFIALEFLEIFSLNGIIPELLMRDKNVFFPLIEEQGAEILQEHFQREGIEIHAGDEIMNIFQENKAETRKGNHVVCDSIAIGIGLDRRREFLDGSGIALGKVGILTNEFFETNIPDVYAAGDSAEFYDVFSDRHRAVGNWTNAFLQGKHAGMSMVGMRAPFKNVSSYSITNFGFQISAVGDCNPEYNTEVRINKDNNEYERLFLKDGALAGAFLINRFSERRRFIKLIEEQKPFAF